MNEIGRRKKSKSVVVASTPGLPRGIRNVLGGFATVLTLLGPLSLDENQFSKAA